MRSKTEKLGIVMGCLIIALITIITSFGLTACGKMPMYNVDFSGSTTGNYTIAPSQWTKSQEDGFEAVYTLTGTVAYDKEDADRLGYGGLRNHIVLIKFTSDQVEKVSYNSTTGEGFYAIIDKGTDNEKVKHQSFSSGDTSGKSTTYFFYQGVDETVRTFTLNLSFDGKEEHERAYKFVIDPQNYTLQEAPQSQVNA